MAKPKRSARDPESHQREASTAAVSNPYTGGPPVLPTYHPINVLKRTGYIVFALVALHKLDALKAILRSPKVSHEWFKIGLAGSLAILSIKAYVELIAGKLQKQTVNYKNFRQTTHVVLILLIVTSLAFHVALWPHFGVTTFLVLFLVGVVLLQACLLIPTYGQNAVAAVAMTFFLQEYK